MKKQEKNNDFRVDPRIYPHLSASTSGYTLIEVLVAIAVFFIVVAGPTGFFIASVRGQRKVLSAREITDSSSYTLEYISRALRMAKKAKTSECIPNNTNYEIFNNGTGVRFLNYERKCREFLLSGSQLGERQSPDDKKVNLGNFLPLTPNDLEISFIKFNIIGESQTDQLQPRVTIYFEIQKKGQPETKMRFQTTISQRDLDVEY